MLQIPAAAIGGGISKNQYIAGLAQLLQCWFPDATADVGNKSIAVKLQTTTLTPLATSQPKDKKYAEKFSKDC